MLGHTFIHTYLHTYDITKAPRIMGPASLNTACLKSTKHPCSQVHEDREKMVKHLWENMGWGERKMYVSGLVDVTPVKRKRGSAKSSRRSSTLSYYLKVDKKRKPVCKKMFLSTLGFREWCVLHWVEGRNVAP